MVSEDINPEKIPPTEDAANYHALRVHLQVSQREQPDLKCLNPIDMGWKRTDRCFETNKNRVECSPRFYIECCLM